MISQNKKYRKLVFILYPLYVNFFLLTPFLHYHAEENSLQPDKIDIHSHILNEHDEEHSHHGSDLELDDCNNHEHVYEVNTYKFTKLTKSVSLNHITNLLTFNNIPDKPLNKKINQQILLDLPSKINWEKSVHTATNSSPPQF